MQYTFILFISLILFICHTSEGALDQHYNSGYSYQDVLQIFMFSLVSHSVLIIYNSKAVSLIMSLLNRLLIKYIDSSDASIKSL